MDPGDYRTNVLSFNNFTSIDYEFLEPKTPSSENIRVSLRNIERLLRQDGRLAHLDTVRDGIWLFQGGKSSSNLSKPHKTENGVIDVLGIQLVVVEQGVFEPASLAKAKQSPHSVLNSASSNSSPSSSLENSGRAGFSVNSRAVQANAAHNASQEAFPSQGQKPLDRQDLTWPAPADLHERFISAVLGSLVSILCRDEGFIPLNPRTLILNQSIASSPADLTESYSKHTGAITLATLDISLTPLGTVIIKIYSDEALGLQSICASSLSNGQFERLAPGTMLWLAPGGNTAKFHAFSNQKGLPRTQTGKPSVTTPADSKLSELNELTVKSWQSKCIQWLSSKGIDTSYIDSGGWLFVQMLAGNSSLLGNESLATCNGSSVVPWPALLCFTSSNTAISRPLTNQQAAKQVTDPLSFAEEWFMSKIERSNTLEKRVRDRQNAEALSREQAEVDARALQSNSYSPVVLRRGSNAGAMYPTPPDAIHHPVGVTPVFDGAGSTPNNPNANPFAAQDGSAIATTSGVPDVDVDMWDTPNKKDRNNDTDGDLFGDLGGDMFGNDVTDADFSFFDEPDEVEPEVKTEIPVAANMSTITEDPVRKPAFVASLAGVEGMRPPPLKTKQPPDLDKRAIVGAMKPPRKVNTHEVVDTNFAGEKSGGITRTISPVQFDQESIFQRLVKDATSQKVQKRPRRESLFDKIDFENSLSLVDDKYGAQGLYSVSDQKGWLPVLGSGLPQTNYLSSRKKSHQNEFEVGKIPQLLLEDKMSENQEFDEAMDFMVDSDGMSTTSEQDDTSRSTDDTSAVPTTGFEKTWLTEDRPAAGMPSFDPMSIDFEQSSSTPQSAVGTQLPFPDLNATDWSLTSYFTTPEPEMLSSSLNDLECIATAQILVDQVVAGTLQVPWLSEQTRALNKTTAKGGLVRSVAKVARLFFKDLVSCTVKTFSEIQGVPVLNSGLRLPPRPINPFSIPLPQLELRRSDSKLSVLPSAISFWENLGLAPSGGTKDVLSVCVYPDLDGAQSGVTYFNEQIRNTYESFRLGTHEIIVARDLFSGHLPYPLETDPQNSFRNLATLRETVARLANSITSIFPEEKNFVIYFMYPTDNPTLLVHICSAFQHLFHLYRKALVDRKVQPSNELVLQLVPIDFVASSTSIPIPTPIEYGRLCLEVYGRCMDFASSAATPAIMLERPLPRGIDFKLNPTPSAAVLQEHTCLHIAYAQSADSRWITAVWTDNRGTQQMNASYCLGRKNEPISMSFSNVAAEIWDTTLDFVSSKRIHWRIFIAKVGIMETSEVETWIDLASKESDAQTKLTLLTVHTEPSLRLLPPALSLPAARDSTQTTTPVSTPQNSILSPDMSTPNPPTTTPSDQSSTVDPDPTTRLLLLSDQTHGLILSHRLSNSRSLFHPNPALVSGYVIKHSTPTPVLIEVNVIHGGREGNPRHFYEALLREVLTNYAGLGTLSRARGTTSTGDARPWHIAAAEKGVKVLHALM